MKKFSIIQSEKESIISGSQYGLMLHEPIGGPNKRISEKLGLCVWVTLEEHRRLHDTHEGELKDRELSILCQKVWMEQNNNDRDKWYSMFYKFYEEG